MLALFTGLLSVAPPPEVTAHDDVLPPVELRPYDDAVDDTVDDDVKREPPAEQEAPPSQTITISEDETSPPGTGDDGTASPDDAAEPAPGEDLTEEIVAPPGTDGGRTPRTKLPNEKRTILVSTSALGAATPKDVFAHAGGRSLLYTEEIRSFGATNVGEAMNRMPGVRAIEGSSGLGSQDTKLNVAVRGVDPRLSSRSTILLDEVPLAPAPYGQPQMSLFPLSMFSIDRIDAVRGGASVRFGPQTSGGVFNLVSKPIPEHPQASGFAQIDTNLDVSLGAAYGATHGKFGMWVEYAPRLGKTYRDHSDKTVHGNLLKLRWQIRKDMDLTSTTHTFYEDTEIPGGINRQEYEEDRFQSLRPFDSFRGNRQGTSLRWGWTPKAGHALSASAYYAHTYRRSTLASNKGSDPSLIERRVSLPRRYHVVGVEPRYTWRYGYKRFASELATGARLAFEFSNNREVTVDPGGILETENDDARLGAVAGYVEEKLEFLDGKLALDAGVRLESVQIARRSNLGDPETLYRSFFAPLPAVSLWGTPTEGLSLWIGYGRSFGPPQFLQISVAQAERRLVPERANSADTGIKIDGLGGLYGEGSFWYKGFERFIDVGEDSIDNVGDTHAWGTEIDLSWEPGDLWDPVAGLEIYGGHAWTDSRIINGIYVGNKMAWYPTHEAWAGIAHTFPFGLKLGIDFTYVGEEFADYGNRVEEDPTISATGIIPEYALLGVFARIRRPLSPTWRIEATAGVKNVTNTEWISRTDDRNAGILAQRPRTFYFNLGISHDFLPSARKREERSRRRRTRSRTAETLPNMITL